METTERQKITVEASINAPVEKVWESWTAPEHIVNWNNASDDWHTPRAENDLRTGGKFLSRMEARDGSMGFDFEGTYDEVVAHRSIIYTMPDGRKVNISFSQNGEATEVVETFDAESTNSPEMQRDGWQAILNNFKKYVEKSTKMKKIYIDKLIDAPTEKVYKTMIDEKKYAEWTAAFNASSHYKGSWEKGSKILFIGADEEGNEGGMVSRIRENIPNKYISIEHLGLLQDGKEITSGPEVEGWAGAMENYTFTEENGKTKLSVEMDANDDFMAYFEETWPKALDKLKALCEA